VRLVALPLSFITRILALLAALFIVLAGCSSGTDGETATEAGTAQQGDTAEADSSESPAAADADEPAPAIDIAATDESSSDPGEETGEAATDAANETSTDSGIATGGDDPPDDAEATAEAEYGPDDPGSSSENVYDDLAVWICHPDKAAADDDCRSADRDATLINADGSMVAEPFTSNDDSPVDCLYYYPTASEDATFNSDRIAGAETGTTISQTSRLTEVCNVWAPVYRSVTLSALSGSVDGDREEGNDIAQADIEAAWEHYLANSDPERGVVLIGHSQGAGRIRQLIEDRIDDDPEVRDRLVAAYILGSTVTVPDGELVGGDFDNVPVCSSPDETGCVISYSSYVDTDAPDDDTPGIFARADGDRQAVCVSPAALLGEPTDAVFDTDFALRNTDPAPEVATRWIRVEGLIETRCVETGDYNYLEVKVVDDTPIAAPDLGFQPGWGAHIHDVGVEYNNIARLIERQAAAR